jgi:hypothetical protein
MITRINSTIIKEMLDAMKRECQWLGVLEWPPSTFSSATESRSPEYSRQFIAHDSDFGGWTETNGLLVQKYPLTFSGLDTPSMVSALGLFKTQKGRNLSAWGPLPTPIRVHKGTLTVKAGPVSLRIA